MLLMPNDWASVPLANVLVQDVSYVTHLEPRLYPKLSVRLYGRGVVLDSPTNGSMVKMARHQIAKPGQVILSEIWAKKGAIGIVPPEGAGALVTSHFFLFDIDERRVLRYYLDWMVRGNHFADVLDSQAHGTTGYAAIRPKQFFAIKIPLPSLTEQQRIVARIEVLARLVEEARGLRRAAMNQADRMMRITSERLFEDLGTSTPSTAIGEVFSIRNDLIRPTDGKSGQIRFIGLQHVESHTGKKISEEIVMVEELQGRKFKFSPGEVVYGYLRPYLNKVWVADCEGVCSVDQYVIRPNVKLVDTSYLAHYMLSGTFLRRAIELTHNLMLPRLRTDLLESIPIPIPSLAQQMRIGHYLDKLRNGIDGLRQLQAGSQKEIEALMPSILAMAFAGRS